MQHSSLPHCRRLHIWRLNKLCRLKRLYALLILLSLLFALSLPASAQFSPDRQWSVFHRHDGLISNDVHTVLADEDAIWVGTSDGVSRFDGGWRSFPSIGEGNVPTSLDLSVPPGTVSALARVTDPPGILAATDRGYVARWDGQAWTLVAALESPIHALAAVKDTLWIATEGGLQVMRGKDR